MPNQTKSLKNYSEQKKFNNKWTEVRVVKITEDQMKMISSKHKEIRYEELSEKDLEKREEAKKADLKANNPDQVVSKATSK